MIWKQIYLRSTKAILIILMAGLFVQCEEDDPGLIVKDPSTAEIQSIDRFSDDAAALMRRSLDPSLPAANEPINFDQTGFLTQSLGPDGQVVQYYNFDVQYLAPAPVYVLQTADGNEITGQLNIIDVIPGETGYNDFWIMHMVTVPDDYVANTVASYQAIVNQGYAVSPTYAIVNCPVVPYGSTASKRYRTEDQGIRRFWYKDKITYYFTFEEKALTSYGSAGWVPYSPIYVTFNINPDPANALSGPMSGIKLETGGIQSHNVIETIPADDDYSPLWEVYVYDNADFENVSDLTSAKAANILMSAAMYVNCPVVYVEN